LTEKPAKKKPAAKPGAATTAAPTVEEHSAALPGRPGASATIAQSPDGRITVCVNVVTVCGCGGGGGASAEPAPVPEFSGPTGSPGGGPDNPENYYLDDPGNRDAVKPFWVKDGATSVLVTKLAQRVLTRTTSIKTVQPSQWTNKVAINNRYNVLTGDFHAAPFFFGTRKIGSTTYQQGYCIIRSTKDPGGDPYALYRAPASGESTYSWAVLPEPSTAVQLTPTRVTISKIERFGDGSAQVTVNYTEAAPNAAWYVVVVPHNVEPVGATSATEYDRQGVAAKAVATVGGQKITVPSVRSEILYAFLVDGDPRVSDKDLPKVKSNVHWLAT
jgi:hypothetical protein